MGTIAGKGETPLDNEVYGAVGAALGSLLAGGAAYLKARNDKVGQSSDAVALAQSKLAHYITAELQACHEQQAELRRDFEERSGQRDRERDEYRAALLDIQAKLDECERHWRQHDSD